MILEQETPKSSNIRKIKYNTDNNEMAVFFIPKLRKNSFKTLEDLHNAQKELMNEVGLSEEPKPDGNIWKVFEEKYKLNFFEELDRLERNPNKIYIYSNVEVEVYHQIVKAESVGSELNKLVVKNKDKYPFKLDLLS